MASSACRQSVPCGTEPPPAMSQGSKYEYLNLCGDSRGKERSRRNLVGCEQPWSWLRLSSLMSTVRAVTLKCYLQTLTAGETDSWLLMGHTVAKRASMIIEGVFFCSKIGRLDKQRVFCIFAKILAENFKYLNFFYL